MKRYTVIRDDYEYDRKEFDDLNEAIEYKNKCTHRWINHYDIIIDNTTKEIVTKY